MSDREFRIDYPGMELRLALLKGVDADTADRITAKLTEEIRTRTLREVQAYLGGHQIGAILYAQKSGLVPDRMTGGYVLAEDVVRSMIPGEHVAWTEKI